MKYLILICLLFISYEAEAITKDECDNRLGEYKYACRQIYDYEGPEKQSVEESTQENCEIKKGCDYGGYAQPCDYPYECKTMLKKDKSKRQDYDDGVVMGCAFSKIVPDECVKRLKTQLEK